MLQADKSASTTRWPRRANSARAVDFTGAGHPGDQDSSHPKQAHIRVVRSFLTGSSAPSTRASPSRFRSAFESHGAHCCDESGHVRQMSRVISDVLAIGRGALLVPPVVAVGFDGRWRHQCQGGA
jgi:hypothetical protein